MNIFELNNSKISDEVVTAATENASGSGKLLILNDTLKQLGWNLVGMGSYGFVYEGSKSESVLKVNIKPDDAYAHYVDIIKLHDNPHFPLISDMKVFKIGKTKYYVYLIEKLKPLPATLESDWIASWISKIAANSDKTIKQISKTIPQFLIDNPLLVEAAQIVGENLLKYLSDLHSGNIMQREDGTIVITDPYFMYSDEYEDDPELEEFNAEKYIEDLLDET